MAFGGGFGGPGGGFGGPGGFGGMGRLRSSLDAGEGQDVLGRVYDLVVLRRLPQYMAWVKKHMLWATAGLAVRTAGNIAMPLMIKVITDQITAKNFSGLNTGVLIYLGLVMVMWLGQYVNTLQLSYAGQGIILKMRTQMFEHLHQLPMSFHDNNKVGKIMSRVQNDVDQLQTLLTQDIMNIIADIVTMAVIIMVMFSMNAQLALITLGVVPVLVLAILIWQNYARRTFIRVRQAIAEVNDNLQESISGVRVTQSLSREGVNLGKFDNVNKAHLDANVDAARAQAFMMPTVQILTDASYVLVLIFGGFQVLAGTMSVGVIIAFLLYIQRFFDPVREVTMLYTDLQRAMASAHRIFELIDVVPDIIDNPGAIELPPIKGEVKFDKVKFSYVPGTEILHDIDLTINPGETVAIAGRTGAGKSSLTSLIARFYEVNGGAVLVDGYDVKSVTQKSLRDKIGIVPQDPYLFSGTVGENIKYGKLDATQDEIVEAAKAAGVHDLITRMSRGYDTAVGERGANLSAGQRQLICLARAILANPPIMILDEATSNVDTNTERIMQESLKRLSKGRTVIIIAHRLSTVTHADRIIILEHGNIIESGNHQSLMAKQGVYYQMFETLSAVEV
ncbi:MAG: ABC transporter ATP-binding protein [Chloroflexi bacterium]|nr:ABC transporter ATP-binding protein [Chloroflexota bacterium]